MQYQQSNGKFVTFDGADGPKLYFCDPAKNTKCSKESCHKDCFHTSNEEFGLFTPEKPKLSDIYTTQKEFEDKVCEILARDDGPCKTCEDRNHCISGTRCYRFQKWLREQLYSKEEIKDCSTCKHDGTGDEHCEICSDYGLVPEMWEKKEE